MGQHFDRLFSGVIQNHLLTVRGSTPALTLMKKRRTQRQKKMMKWKKRR